MCANVIPIYKSGSKFSVSNYRPVSLTLVVYKVIQSIIKDSIDKYLDEFNLVKETQHGFVKNRSCVTNLLEYLEYCARNLDQGNPVDVIN